MPVSLPERAKEQRRLGERSADPTHLGTFFGSALCLTQATGKASNGGDGNAYPAMAPGRAARSELAAGRVGSGGGGAGARDPLRSPVLHGLPAVQRDGA